MTNENTGPLRKVWNKFKRGMSEINFILNITQTLVILWTAQNYREMFTNFYVFFIGASMMIAVAAISVGGFAIKNVDPTLSIINPFAQDMIKHRRAVAIGLLKLAREFEGQDRDAVFHFEEAVELTEKWIE